MPAKRRSNLPLARRSARLRVDLQLAGDIDDGEQQVAELVLQPVVRGFSGCVLYLGRELRQFLADLGQGRTPRRASRSRRGRRAIAASGRGSAPEGRGRCRPRRLRRARRPRSRLLPRARPPCGFPRRASAPRRCRCARRRRRAGGGARACRRWRGRRRRRRRRLAPRPSARGRRPGATGRRARPSARRGRRGRWRRRPRRLPRWCAGRWWRSSASTSHGQPCAGSRSRAMSSSNRSVSVLMAAPGAAAGACRARPSSCRISDIMENKSTGTYRLARRHLRVWIATPFHGSR